MDDIMLYQYGDAKVQIKIFAVQGCGMIFFAIKDIFNG
jgi:hypothetical protein